MSLEGVEVSSLCSTIFKPDYLLALVLLLAQLVISGCANPQFQAPSGQQISPKLERDYILVDDTYKLPYRVVFPDVKMKGLVVALHGFNDYSQAFEGFCAALLAQDYACLAYDQRGFGESAHTGLWPAEGRLQSDLAVVVELMSQAYPSVPLYLAGESMGGAVIMTALSENKPFWQKRVVGVMLFAPAVWARQTQPWYQRWLLWLAVHTFPGWAPTGEGLGVQATDNIEALRAMGRDPLVIKQTRIDTIYGLTNLMDKALDKASEMARVPLAVFYGDRDEVIPKHPTCLMLKKLDFADTELAFASYLQGYHMLTRDLQAANFFEDVITWLETGSLSQKQSVIDYCA